MNWSTACSFMEGSLATSLPCLWACGSGRSLWDPSGVSSLLFSNRMLAKWSKFNGYHIPEGFYENQNTPWQNLVGKCSRQKYALSVSEVALALGCFLLLYVWTGGKRRVLWCSLRRSTAHYLVNGFVDKSSHLPDKDGLQKVMWGATLSFTAVGYCFCVLTGGGKHIISATWHKQGR